MPSIEFYKHCLSDELQEQVTKQLSKLVPEQLSLNEEVAIHKARCADLVKEWSEAREHYKAAEKIGDVPLMNAARARLYVVSDKMADSIKLHKDIVLTAATTEAKAREALTERTLMLLMNAVIDLVHNYFNDGTSASIELMKRFEDELRNRVVIQEEDNLALAIEAEFFEMLDTVPSAPVPSAPVPSAPVPSLPE